MAKYTNDELLEAFGEMTLVELSEFVKRRMSSTSSSPPSATRRSRSSRLSAPSPTSAWPRPRLLSTALRRPSSRRPRRKMPRRPRLSWKRLAPPSSSSNDRGSETRALQLCTDPAVAHAAAGSARMRRSAHRSRDRFCERLTRPDMGVPHRCALQSEIPASMR